MTGSDTFDRPGRRLADRTLRLLVADGLAVPAGLLLAGGAAVVTMVVSMAGAGAMWTALAVSWDLRPPRASVCRAAVASALAYGLGVSRVGGPPAVPFELAIIGAVVIAAQLAMGEFTPSDRAALRSLIGRAEEHEAGAS